MRHGIGVSIDGNGSVFEGKFEFGKRQGEGKLTESCVKDPNKFSIIEGVWENDILV